MPLPSMESLFLLVVKTSTFSDLVAHMAFGIDDLLGGLVMGGLNLFGTAQTNQTNTANFQQGLLFNAQQAEINRAFGSREAEIARNFNSAESSVNRDWLSQQTQAGQQFNMYEAAKQRDFNAQQQQRGENFNAWQAEINRQFQNTMSSTAYRRAMEDMRAAGLNPIMAAAKGGASTPGGASASIGPVGGSAASASIPGSSAASGPAAHGSAASAGALPTIQNMIGNALSTAAEWRRLEPQVRQMEQQTRIGKEEERVKRNESDLVKSKELYIDQQRRNAETQNKIQDEQLDIQRKEATTAKIDQSVREGKVGQATRYMGTIFRDLNPFANSARTFQQIWNDRGGQW